MFLRPSFITFYNVLQRTLQGGFMSLAVGNVGKVETKRRQRKNVKKGINTFQKAGTMSWLYFILLIVSFENSGRYSFLYGKEGLQPLEQTRTKDLLEEQSEKKFNFTKQRSSQVENQEKVQIITIANHKHEDFVKGFYYKDIKGKGRVSIMYCSHSDDHRCRYLGPHKMYFIDEIKSLKQIFYSRFYKSVLWSSATVVGAVALYGVALVTGFDEILAKKAEKTKDKLPEKKTIMGWKQSVTVGGSMVTAMTVYGTSVWDFIKHRFDPVFNYKSSRNLRYFAELDVIVRDHYRSDSVAEFADQLDLALTLM